MTQLHMEATWIPGGVHVDSRCILNYRLKSFLDGVQMESMWICGVHVESVGEGKVQKLAHTQPLMPFVELIDCCMSQHPSRAEQVELFLLEESEENSKFVTKMGRGVSFLGYRV